MSKSTSLGNYISYLCCKIKAESLVPVMCSLVEDFLELFVDFHRGVKLLSVWWMMRVAGMDREVLGEFVVV